jgi:putative transposase
MYISDLTDDQWELVKHHFEKPKTGAGRIPYRSDMRDIVDAILYIVKTGCQWRMLPKDFPPHQTVYYYYKKWKEDNTWDAFLQDLVSKARIKEGRNAEPTYGVIDSQSAKTNADGEKKGFDGNKKIKGRKRHIIVDVFGFLLAVIVHAANIHDAKAAENVMKKAIDQYPTIKAFSGDEGYPKTAEEAAQSLGREMHISKKIKSTEITDTKGFKVTPKRWVVERTFGWFGFSRRLSRDFEKTTTSAEAIIKISHAKLLINRLTK